MAKHTLKILRCEYRKIFNPIHDGGGGKKAPYQFSPCNFYKRSNWPSKLSDFQF